MEIKSGNPLVRFTIKASTEGYGDWCRVHNDAPSVKLENLIRLNMKISAERGTRCAAISLPLLLHSGTMCSLPMDKLKEKSAIAESCALYVFPDAERLRNERPDGGEIIHSDECNEYLFCDKLLGYSREACANRVCSGGTHTCENDSHNCNACECKGIFYDKKSVAKKFFWVVIVGLCMNEDLKCENLRQKINGLHTDIKFAAAILTLYFYKEDDKFLSIADTAIANENISEFKNEWRTFVKLPENRKHVEGHCTDSYQAIDYYLLGEARYAHTTLKELNEICKELCDELQGSKNSLGENYQMLLEQHLSS
jgi:hypothetical protein